MSTAPAPSAPTAPTVLHIGGRDFALLEDGSLEHDIYLQRELRAAGLLTFDGGAAAVLDPTASEDENALAFLVSVYDSGHTFTLLAGLLVDAAPDGTPMEWTPAMAATNAAFFARVRDRESKPLLQGVLSAGVAAFFGAALSSRTSSRSSSSATPADLALVPAPPSAPTPSATASATATATGVTSSSPSSSTTPSADATSDAGPSATP